MIINGGQIYSSLKKAFQHVPDTARLIDEDLKDEYQILIFEEEQVEAKEPK